MVVHQQFLVETPKNSHDYARNRKSINSGKTATMTNA